MSIRMQRTILTSAGLLALARHARAEPAPTEATVLLPSATDGLWASVITEDASATEYFVACGTAFDHPQDCDAPFTGVTVTAAPSGVVDVSLDGTVYHCQQGEGDDDSFCENKAVGPAGGETEVIPASETADWLATLTIVEPTPVSESEEADEEGGEDEGRRGGGGGGHGGGSHGGGSHGGGGGHRPVVGGGGGSHHTNAAFKALPQTSVVLGAVFTGYLAITAML
jgi:uncharacterized membrane protein YgcG